MPTLPFVEWTKFRSVRSTIWALIILVVLDLGFTLLFTWLTSWGSPQEAN